MLTVYYEIAFLQHDEAGEIFGIIDNEGEQAAIDYLDNNYDYGTECEHSPRLTAPWGSSDKIFQSGSYTLSYNTQLDYISLTRMSEE